MSSSPKFDLMPTETASLSAIVRAEIDTQVATAHAYPRNMTTFQTRAIAIVELDEETAESCIYRRPVGKGPDGQQKYAEGMSVRMAEIVGSCFGNLRCGAQIISQTERQIVARGFAHDLESNMASTSECVEATVKRDGSPFDERMRVVVAKAALAKARRDAIFQVVPRALCKKVEAAARSVISGNKKPLTERRLAVVEWIKKTAVDAARVYAALGVMGPDEMNEDHFTTLTGLRTAMKEGDISIDEAFPQIVKGRTEPKSDARAEAAAGLAPTSAGTAEKTPIDSFGEVVLIRKGIIGAGISEARLIQYLRAQGLDAPDSLNDAPPALVSSTLGSLRDILLVILKEDGAAAESAKTAEKLAETAKKAEAAQAAASQKPAATTTAAPKKGASSFNYLKSLNGLMKLEKVDEVELLRAVRELGLADESLSSLDEINIQSPNSIRVIHDQFASIAKTILANRGGAQSGEML